MTIASSSRPRPITRASDDGGLWRSALGLTTVTLAGFGFLYAAAGVGVGQLLFPDQANGSLVFQGDRKVGSALVAQPFTGAGYFQPRPSAAAYNPLALAASNQARTNPDMRARIEETRAAVARRDGIAPSAAPGDLVTQSGSGIDPHISVEGAAVQVDRVARERGLDRKAVERLVTEHTEGPQLGALGQTRVNVLLLNLGLDALGASAPVAPRKTAS